MQPQYIGNNDFRGYLSYLNSQGDGRAYNALQYAGNDGGVDEGKLRQYTAGSGGDPAQDQQAFDFYKNYVTDTYNEWNSRNADQTGLLGASTSRTGSTGGAGTGVDKLAVQRQLDQLNQMLGVYAPQKQTGLSDIDTKFNESGRRLGEQRASALTGYQDQETQALEGRTRGYEQVDNYALQSANSLNRIFQGANSGNSSVARLLAPKLVGKAADSRRLDVTTTANQNLSGIKKARDEATSEFDYAQQDLENNRGYEKDAFEKNLTQAELDQYNQKLSLESQGGFDTSGTQNEINARTARLSQLFGASKFNPSYQARAVAPKAVQLNDYKVDPVQLQAGQTGQSESSYYNPLLRKKQELRVR